MENSLFEFGIKIVLSIAGLLIYSLMKIGDKLKEFSPAIFFAENKGFWLWAISLQVLVAIVLLVAPNSAEAIREITGIDFGQSMAFLTSGFLLSRIANGITKDKIGTKPEIQPFNGGELPEKPPKKP